ncbi:MAG: hypothetical protein ACP5IB_08220 [Thermoplasmata archaeon]|jgi:hypothetical protein
MNDIWHVEDIMLERNQGVILLMNKKRTKAKLVWLYGQPILGKKNKLRSR